MNFHQIIYSVLIVSHFGASEIVKAREGCPRGAQTELGCVLLVKMSTGAALTALHSHQEENCKGTEANSWLSLVRNGKAKSKERARKGLGGMLGKIPL